MVSVKFAVVLITVAVVLCAQLASAASGKGGRKIGVFTSSHRSRSGNSGGGLHFSSSGTSGGLHLSSSGTSSSRHHSSSSSSSPASHSSSRHNENSGSSAGLSHRGSSSSGSHRSGSSDSGSSVSISVSPSVPQQPQRGRQAKRVETPSGSVTSSGPSRSTPVRVRVPTRRPRGKLTRAQKQARRDKLRKTTTNIKKTEKEVEEKTNQAKKGLLGALSKKLSEKTGKNIDLGSFWASMKNKTKECALESQDTMLDFVKETVSKSIFGQCDDARNYEQLQKDLDSTKKTLRALNGNEKEQLEQCKTFEGAQIILDKKRAAVLKTATEAPVVKEPPKLNLTKEEVIDVLNTAANITVAEDPEALAWDDEPEDNEDAVYRRRRDILEVTIMPEWQDECEETVKNNTIRWASKLEKQMKKLKEETAAIDEKNLENCWSNNFGENLGTATVGTLVDIFSCAILG